MTIRMLMVVGAGQMGSGIAQVAAASGAEVILLDTDAQALRRAYDRIAQNAAKDAEKGRRSTEDASALINRIVVTTDMKAAAQAEMIIEAIHEQKEEKLKLLRQLDRICPPRTILASNTSSLPITELGAATARADKVIGMHFMNPVPVMPLVEVVRGLATSDKTYDEVMELAALMGKTPVAVNDCPGFVSNRVLLPMINEAVFCVYEGVATPEAVDRILKLGMNHPMGPLALADLIGLDTCLSIMEVLHDGFGDSKYRPCPLLRQYVQAGRLGRKSGRGFYSYE
ncbi:3-hydroxybutyryl-CoA dehydrogenase [Paenibacillus sp. J5C_2022]|uniref:3-hydroxyacyl-CoA dehydrogenase family protein n=1 Tax=Paenibacillus sp. J5C2022 TaxID=2977129 RepID=UPI0021D20D9A|nr:3-hydroxybutyryl-CoA dehydrogenase [Paenibacillus sp. J5C2022]MCU6707454.1 3-hydroxybutyryl-CoA dehydrogenase [Paenibacillus sp. J5C2022]